MSPGHSDSYKQRVREEVTHRLLNVNSSPPNVQKGQNLHFKISSGEVSQLYLLSSAYIITSRKAHLTMAPRGKITTATPLCSPVGGVQPHIGLGIQAF